LNTARITIYGMTLTGFHTTHGRSDVGGDRPACCTRKTCLLQVNPWISPIISYNGACVVARRWELVARHSLCVAVVSLPKQNVEWHISPYQDNEGPIDCQRRRSWRCEVPKRGEAD